MADDILNVIKEVEKEINEKNISGFLEEPKGYFVGAGEYLINIVDCKKNIPVLRQILDDGKKLGARPCIIEELPLFISGKPYTKSFLVEFYRIK